MHRIDVIILVYVCLKYDDNFCIAQGSLCTPRSGTYHNHNTTRVNNSIIHILRRQLLKTTIILLPLLGFTWIIGLFAVGEEGKAFAYLFVFANVFQVRETTSCPMLAFIPCMSAHSFLHTSLHTYIRTYIYTSRVCSYLCFMF